MLCSKLETGMHLTVQNNELFSTITTDNDNDDVYNDVDDQKCLSQV